MRIIDKLQGRSLIIRHPDFATNNNQRPNLQCHNAGPNQPGDSQGLTSKSRFNWRNPLRDLDLPIRNHGKNQWRCNQTLPCKSQPSSFKWQTPIRRLLTFLKTSEICSKPSISSKSRVQETRRKITIARCVWTPISSQRISTHKGGQRGDPPLPPQEGNRPAASISPCFFRVTRITTPRSRLSKDCVNSTGWTLRLTGRRAEGISCRRAYHHHLMLNRILV